MKSEFLSQVLDRKRRVCIHPSIPGRARASYSFKESFRLCEFGQQTVNWSVLVQSPSDFGTSVRISKIEIIGRNRMKRKSRATNNPMVPMKVDQSQNVG